MKYSRPICMGGGLLVNACADLQLTNIYLVYVLCTVQDENTFCKVTQGTVP